MSSSGRFGRELQVSEYCSGLRFGRNAIVRTSTLSLSATYELVLDFTYIKRSTFVCAAAAAGAVYAMFLLITYNNK